MSDTIRVTFYDVRFDLRSAWVLPTQRANCPDVLDSEFDRWEQADDDMVEAYGRAVEHVAAGMDDVEVLVTDDRPRADDYARGQDVDEARRVWQSIHDAIEANSDDDGTWRVETDGFADSGAVQPQTETSQ